MDGFDTILIFSHPGESGEDYAAKVEAVLREGTHPDLYGRTPGITRESRSGVYVPDCPLDKRVEDGLDPEERIRLLKSGAVPMRGFRGSPPELWQLEALAAQLGLSAEVLQEEYTSWKRLYDYLSERLQIFPALERSRIGKAYSYHYAVECSVLRVEPGIYEVREIGFNATIQGDESYFSDILLKHGRGYTAAAAIWQAIEPVAPTWWGKQGVT